MKYLIYKITNTVNDKIYIGKHQTNDINDEYIGSGIYLKRSINKYGINKFKKEILYEFDNVDEMNEMELKIVDEDFVKRKDTYNLKLGGEGGWDFNNTKDGIKLRNWTWKTGIWSKAGTKALLKKYKTDVKFKEKMTKAGRKGLIKATKKRKELYPEGIWKGKKHKQESKDKISKANKGKRTGKLNHNYGKCWIYNLKLKQNKSIPKDNLQEWLNEGWIKGRKMKLKRCSSMVEPSADNTVT